MNLRNLLSFTKNELLIGLSVLLLVSVFTFGSRQLRLSSDNALVVEEEIVLQFDEKTDLAGLSAALDSLSIEFDQSELEWSARMLGWRTFQRGSYLLSGEYAYEELLSKLARGIQDPVPVVVLPGITIERFASNLSKEIDATEEEVAAVFLDHTFLTNLKLTKEELFGRMLPETYHVYWTSSPKDVVRRILREFDDKVVEGFQDDLKDSGRTVTDILTMASIVEWEANIEEEKAVISGLYWNRLDRRMRLQADPTVNYAIGERRRLLFEDYEFDHPFNTYMNRGLPPGPITNPSLSTLEATVHPESHDFLYMVANPEGGHIFTRTFEEHQVESEKWRKWLREQYRIKRQRESGS